MRALVVLPVLVPLATAIACLALRPWRAAGRAASVLGALVHLVAAAALLYRVDGAGIQVMQMGDWPAPYGISLVADLLAAIMVTLTGVTGLAVAVYSLGSIDAEREAHGYHALFHVLLMGVSMAFLTGDLFNLYVAFEVMLMASFVLLSLGGERAQLEGAVKYVTLNLLSSAVFLAAVGVLYGVAGTLNMADLALAVQRGTAPGLVATLACLFLVAFGIKAAVFPLFFWLPASYHTPPVAVSALFAGLLTKVGVYALVRAFTLVFTGDTGLTHGLILAVAVLTMVTGVLGAAAQFEFRRVLSFHIVSQIGYMVLGLGLFTPLALAGTVFYLIHHIVVKTNLFLVAGIVKRLGGTLDLGSLGGLYRRRPALALLFLVPAFSLAGIPPLSGFWGKLVLVKAGLDSGHYAVTATALGVSLLTLFSMTKLWNEAFWKEPPEESPVSAAPVPWTLLGPVVALAAITVAVGLGAGPVFDLASRAAAQLADPSQYVRAVLGEGARP
ncbi:MAG: Na+/H+ antiporter subunit D [Holophagales bacterium]|nr:Na+/H+ antiporter subunit D [Holophagales bacterium]